MSEYIGSRISLISKSDIRYVGILHEINSQDSTVALEQVTSFGTEGRRPENEIAGSDSVYEYIVFRGSDVKDLRIEEAPKENKPSIPPPVPDDPAILGGGSRPGPPPGSHGPQSQLLQNRQDHSGHPQFQQHAQPPYQQHGQFPNQRFGPPPGRPSFPGPSGNPPGYPGMHYGPPPPGWQPQSRGGFPYPPGPIHPHHQMPFDGPPHEMNQPQPPNHAASQAHALGIPQSGHSASLDQQQTSKDLSGPGTSKPGSQTATPAPPDATGSAPPPPLQSKPDLAAALAKPQPSQQPGILPMPKTAPTGPKSNRVVPAMPLASPNVKPAVSAAGKAQPTAGSATQASAKIQYQNATQAATAAVAAAMAKLPPAPAKTVPAKPVPDSDAMDNLTKKVNEMRTDDRMRQARQGGHGNYPAGHRGARGGSRRGGREQGKGIEVPNTDFDFETANAKFNKQDLVKEAIASGSPAVTANENDTKAANGNGIADTNGNDDVSIPAAVPTSYDKSSSFFDNISSDLRDREEQADGRRRPSGHEFRNEERRRNMETFGLGSVDGGRGGYRGRGRGRGGYGRGRGSSRGGFRAPKAAVSTPP